jgi:AcrR family transcriptional regulator
MSATSHHRSTRDRPAKTPLSEDAVVDAALAILKSEGLEAVTMRRVAAALDTGAASLYVYVSGREGLLHAMQDRITAAIELEPPDPGIAATAMADPPTTEAALLLTENLLGILLAGSLDPQDAAWGADIFALLVTYAAIEDDVRPAGHHELAAELYTTFAGLPPDRFPLIAAHAAQLVAGDSDERFRFAIDVVLDGMLARAGRQ